MTISINFVGALALASLFSFIFLRSEIKGTRLSSRNPEARSRPIIERVGPKMVAWVGLLFLSLVWASAVSAADVVVKGQELKGSVVGVTAKGVQFQTIYGEGTIVIPWSNIEMIQSDKEFEVLYGEAEITEGRIWGLENDRLLVGESSDRATPIPVDQIYRSITREDYEKSRIEVLRARYRYWTSNFDLSLGYTDATTDTTTFSSGFELRRKKTPTEFFFGAYYLFGTTKEKGEDRITNQNRLFGRTRLDYDLSDRLFSFGQVSAEYDEIQSLSLRSDPTVGLGYRFIKREKFKLSGRTGSGYVYQRFFGGDTENFFTILFGGDLEADLPYGSKFRWTAEYLPAVDNWTGNYIVRTNAEWTMPIIGMMNFKISVIDIYNNRPAPGADRNSFTTLTGLSWQF